MKHLLNGALLAGLALSLLYATVAFGAVSLEYSAPLYLIAALLALIWAAKLLLWKQVSWLRSPTHWAVAAFALYAVARYFTSPVEYDSRLELLHVALYTLIYFVVASNFWRPRDRAVVLVVVMVLAVAEVAYGFTQFGPGGSNAVLNADRAAQYHGRASGTFICPNHFAGFLEIVLGLLLARIAVRRSAEFSLPRRRIAKMLEVLVALVVVAGIVMSLSRGGWIAATAGVVVFGLWGWRTRAVAPRITIGVFAALLVVGAAGYSIPTVRARVAHTVGTREADQSVVLKDVTLAGRTLMWTATLRMIPEHPLFGTGPLTWEWFHLKYRDPAMQMRPKYTHEDVLQLTSDYGIVGLVLVIWIFGCFYWHAARMSRPEHSADQRAFAIGSAVAVSAIVVHSFVDFNMHIPSNAMLVVTLMALTVAMDNGEKGDRRLVMGRGSRNFLAVVLVALVVVGARFGIPMVRADRANTLGDAYKEVLEREKALDLYRSAIAADPGFPAPFSNAGDIFRSQGALASAPEDSTERMTLAREAIVAYLRSLKLNPYQSEVMLRLASAYEMAGDNSAALQAYQRALAVDPNNAFVYMRLGIFYRHLGEDERSAEAFERSRVLGDRDQVAMVNIEDMRRKP